MKNKLGQRGKKVNKYGMKLYPCRVVELDSNTRMTVWWTTAQMEFAYYLAGTGGLCFVDGFGYFYRFAELKEAIRKAFENPYWKELLAKS